MADFLADFTREWAHANVHNYPLEDKDKEIVRLVNGLYRAAYDAGYSRDDIDDLKVEVRDIIQDIFEQVQDADLGFRR